MRLMPVFRFLITALLLVAGGGASVMAQTVYYPQRDPYGRPVQGYVPQQQPGYSAQGYPPGYYPGKLVQPAQPAPQQGFSLRRLFGTSDDPPPARKPVAKPRKPAAPPAAVVRQEKPKPNPNSHIVVFGDALAEAAGQGLDSMFADNADVAVVPRTRGDVSLVRSDSADWPNFIKATLDGGQKITLAVVMLGANDRQALKEGEENVEPLTDRWKDLYRQRVDSMLRTFQERGIPVVWIGLPPMKNNKTSEDLLAMNELYRESVRRHGGAYVDIWPGFVDDENRYVATGPDVDGEPARLRANDGVSFTRAGARKVAHFTDTEIKRILEAGQAANPVAVAPKPGEPPVEGAQPSVEASLPVLGDAPAPAPVVLPMKPLVGPVLPLTRPEVASGGTLVSGTPKLTGDHAYPVQRALRGGVAPSARPGRADDFRWPRS